MIKNMYGEWSISPKMQVVIIYLGFCKEPRIKIENLVLPTWISKQQSNNFLCRSIFLVCWCSTYILLILKGPGHLYTNCCSVCAPTPLICRAGQKGRRTQNDYKHTQSREKCRKRGHNWLINKLSVNNAYFSRIPTPAVLRAITSSKSQPKE